MRLATASIALLLAGCASTPPPAPAPPPEAPKATVLWSVPLAWEADMPVINAKIRDGETKFLVATSASNHMLTKSFASSVRAPVSATRISSKMSGVDKDVEKVEGVVSIKSADAEWRLEQVVATDAEALDAKGIGGLLVPQALVSNTTTVVMDFRGGALTLVEGDAALFEKWFQAKYGEAQKVSLNRQNGVLYADVTLTPGGEKKARISTESRMTQIPAAAVGVDIPDGKCLDNADITAGCIPGDMSSFEGLSLGSTKFEGGAAGAVTNDQTVVGSDLLKDCVIALSVGNQAHLICGG